MRKSIQAGISFAMKRMNLAIKVFFSLFLLGLVISKIDIISLVDILPKIKLFWLCPSFILFLAGIFLMIMRWKYLLDISHQHLAMTDIIQIYFIGLFFNLFLPSSLGGEAVKIYKIAKVHGKALEITSSILMDRIMGLLSLTFLASIFIFFCKNLLSFRLAFCIFFLLNFALMSFFVLIFNIKFLKRLALLRKLLIRLKIFNILKDFYLSLHTYRYHPEALVKAALASILANLIHSVSVYFLALALGIKISIIYFFIIMPLVFILTAIPISIGGLGVQDGAFIFFLGKLGVSSALAFTFSLLFHLNHYGVGVMGGIIYLFEKDKIKKIASKS